MNQLFYDIALSLIPGIGPSNARKLIAYIGSAEGILKESKQNLRKVPGIGDYALKQFDAEQAFRQTEAELEFAERYHIEILSHRNTTYPAKLKHCEDAPLVLYKKGNCDLQNPKVISLVGTRRATDYGKQMCNQLVGGLKELGHTPIIASGLAYGIDIYAHRAALQHALPTVAVLAHGLKTLYPAAHRKTAEDMLAEGALLTEFASGVQAFRNNFLSRNRIVAGMADATIVVESAEKGGALVTADMAMEYGREVLAVPGRAGDKQSKGCNAMIRECKAALVESAEDLVKLLNWDVKHKAPIQRQLFVELKPKEQQLVDLLKKESMSIDGLCKQSGLPMNEVSALLLALEFAGVVKTKPGKRFELV